MKKTSILIFLLLVVTHSFSQVNLNDSTDNMLILSLGMNKTVINNPGFDSWTRANYNKTEGYLLSGNIDITAIFKSYDGGILFCAPYPYGIGSFYFGKRLTTATSKISSYLNFELGSFEAIYTAISPINYIPSASEKSRQLQLHYNAFYLGLSSKNYLNGLSFKTGKGKKGVSCNSGFYFDFGYEPWGGDWDYGYYTGSGKYTQFHSHRVYGIPQLNNVFADAGIFIGIGT